VGGPEPVAIVALTPVATLIVTIIIRLIEIKKATKGKPPANVEVNGNDNTVIITTAGDNTKMVVSRHVWELYNSKAIDTELGKIAAPLREGKIDAVSLGAKDRSGSLEPVTITSSEKGFFQHEDVTTTTSKPLELDGRLVSLNKDSNRGTFQMQNGKSVRYHFKGADENKFYTDFSRKGAVRVECIASFDDNLELKGIEITSSQKLQADLDFSSVTDVRVPTSDNPPIKT
jgi:hypothetical protein